MKQMYYIGVDVSKGKVDIAVLSATKEVVLEQVIKNEVRTLNRFFRMLYRKLKIGREEVLVCCETTGHFLMGRERIENQKSRIRSKRKKR
jgi:transposase